jgi:hypothetical protein
MTRLMRRATWVIGLTALVGCYRPPSENQLIRRFESHRAEFDRLLAMATADKAFRRIPAEGLPPKGLPHARFKDYLAAFRQLGIENGLVWEPTSSSNTLFVVAGSEIPIGGKNRSEGYAYSPVVPTPLVKDLAIRELPVEIHRGNGERTVYRQLQDHWYLFYQVSW